MNTITKSSLLSEDKEDYVPVFDESDKSLVQKDITIKDLEAKNKALEERNTALINTNTELNEALKQASFVQGNNVAAVIETKWDYVFENTTLLRLRPQLMNIYAEVGDVPFSVFIKKVITNEQK
ncbi:MAG TPA: hypothetical protein VF220_03760 [Nitrososphaeraceae archaeon]